MSSLFFTVGGLGFTLSEIGISMAVIGILLLPLTILLFPMVCLPMYHACTRECRCGDNLSCEDHHSKKRICLHVSKQNRLAHPLLRVSSIIYVQLSCECVICPLAQTTLKSQIYLVWFPGPQCGRVLRAEGLRTRPVAFL